jgi:hypothetical protein
MNHKSALLGQVALWVIAALGALFFILIMLGNDSGIDAGIYLTYVAFGLAILLALFSGVMSAFSGGSLKGTLIPLAVFGGLFLVSYLLADGAVKPSWNISSSASKLIGAGLMMTGLAALLAVLAAVYGAVVKLFK